MNVGHALRQLDDTKEQSGSTARIVRQRVFWYKILQEINPLQKRRGRELRCVSTYPSLRKMFEGNRKMLYLVIHQGLKRTMEFCIRNLLWSKSSHYRT